METLVPAPVPPDTFANGGTSTVPTATAPAASERSVLLVPLLQALRSHHNAIANGNGKNKATSKQQKQEEYDAIATFLRHVNVLRQELQLEEGYFFELNEYERAQNKIHEFDHVIEHYRSEIESRKQQCSDRDMLLKKLVNLKKGKEKKRKESEERKERHWKAIKPWLGRRMHNMYTYTQTWKIDDVQAEEIRYSELFTKYVKDELDAQRHVTPIRAPTNKIANAAERAADLIARARVPIGDSIPTSEEAE
jgi:hypothetical protein